MDPDPQHCLESVLLLSQHALHLPAVGVQHGAFVLIAAASSVESIKILKGLCHEMNIFKGL